MQTTRADLSEPLAPLAVAPLTSSGAAASVTSAVRPTAVSDDAIGNVVESGTLRVALVVERVTNRFVFFRLRAAGSTRRLRCTVATIDPARRHAAIVLLQSVLAPGDVLDAGFIVRTHLAAGVTAEISGSDVAVIVRAPEGVRVEESPVRRTLAAIAGARPPSIGAAAGFAAVASAALVGFATFAALDHSASRSPQPTASAAAYGAADSEARLDRHFAAPSLSNGVAMTGALAAEPRANGSAGGGSAQTGSSSPTAPLAPIDTRSLGGSRRGTAAEATLPPLIGAASLEKPVVSGGAPILVTYQIRKPSGEVRLIDDRGTVRAAALLTTAGSSIVVAPQVDVEQDFRVVLNAEDGARREERSLAVRIRPVPGPTSPPTVEEQRIATKTGRPFVLTQRAVTSGESLWVTIVRHENAMRVTMLDQDGNDVASTNVDRNRTRIELKTPRGLFPEMYTVDVSYVDANGQEHSVSPILVR